MAEARGDDPPVRAKDRAPSADGNRPLPRARSAGDSQTQARRRVPEPEEDDARSRRRPARGRDEELEDDAVKLNESRRYRDDEPEDDWDDPPARPAASRPRRAARGGRRRGIWVAAAGVVVLSAVVVFQLVKGGRGGRAGAADPDHGLVAAARQPPDGAEDSPFPAEPLPPGDPATWKVKATAVPAPTDLAPVFPLWHNGAVRAILFCGPETPTAAVLTTDGQKPHVVGWERLDLRRPGPGARVSFTVPWGMPNAGSFPSALSPSGGTVAFGSGVGDLVGVVGAEELRVNPVQAPGAPGQPAVWLGFASEERLLVLRGGQLSCHDPYTYKPYFAVAVAHVGGATLTWDRKWVGVPTADGSEWFSTADGSHAGRLLLPPEFRVPERNTYTNPRLAVTRDGKRVASVAFNRRGDLLVAVWDLASGRPVESVVLPSKHTKTVLQPPLSWCGDRRLLFGTGEVLDLDLRAWFCRLDWYGHQRCPGPRPDDRCWLVIPPAERIEAQLAARYGKGFFAGKVRATYSGLLVACTMPPAAGVADVERAREAGLVWHPGASVRLEVDAGCPEEHRSAFLQAAGTAIVGHGFRIDPSANIRIKLVPRVAGGPGAGEPREFGGIPGVGPPEVEPDYVGTCSWEITDRRGRPLFAVPPDDELTEPGTPDGRALIWKRLIDRQAGVSLPRWYLRDGSGTRLRLRPVILGEGIDGFWEPQVFEFDDEKPDPFRLDTDPLLGGLGRTHPLRQAPERAGVEV